MKNHVTSQHSQLTHAGLYRYKGLMFGVTAAPEVYQHAIQQALHEYEGVRNISDVIHSKYFPVSDWFKPHA